MIHHRTPEFSEALHAVLAGMRAVFGTSGNVYPAAGFVDAARGSGAHTVELNLEPSEGASLFHEAEYGQATQIVPSFIARLKAVM